jgi:hypothetical protein
MLQSQVVRTAYNYVAKCIEQSLIGTAEGLQTGAYG